jgi:hypothetical protein
MRFAVGQAFECNTDARREVVAQIRNDGREGLLRFLDDGHEEWLLWVEFHQAGKWRQIGGSGA